MYILRDVGYLRSVYICVTFYHQPHLFVTGIVIMDYCYYPVRDRIHHHLYVFLYSPISVLGLEVVNKEIRIKLIKKIHFVCLIFVGEKQFVVKNVHTLTTYPSLLLLI